MKITRKGGVLKSITAIFWWEGEGGPATALKVGVLFCDVISPFYQFSFFDEKASSTVLYQINQNLFEKELKKVTGEIAK